MTINWLPGFLFVWLVGTGSSCACAQDLPELLKPPPKASVALVLFQDLQSPLCASVFPAVNEAARSHNVPLVILDFPVPRHEWSFEAAVYDRYFTTQSQQLGEDFRGYILQSQPRISDEPGLRRAAERFAADHQVRVPQPIDPDGKLAFLVHQDFVLGQRVGVEITPTVFVVSSGNVSPAMVNAVERDRLNQEIAQALKKAKEMPGNSGSGSQTKRK